MFWTRQKTTKIRETVSGDVLKLGCQITIQHPFSDITCSCEYITGVPPRQNLG